VSSAGQPSRRAGAGFGTVLNLFRGRQATRSAPATAFMKSPLLPADLWELLGRDQPHWAGNINVFIGAHRVERHLARALRVYPGRTNLAMFLVGGRESRDAFAFDLEGLAPDWKAALYDMTHRKTLLVGPSDPAIQERQWVESVGGLMVMLATHPPARCRTGNVEVHVTRRSCGTSAIVEFNLDPNAQGAGCYFV
jgi:hypothetical protein